MADAGGSHIPFSEEIPDATRPYIKILVPYPGEPVVGVMVTQSFLVMPTHYWHPRTYPHLEPVEKCWFCEKHVAIRNRVFVGSWDFKYGRYVIQQFSPSSVTDNKSLRELQGKLRGWQLTTIRSGKSQQSRVFCRVEAYRERDLPPAFDLAEQLQRIYRPGRAVGEVE